MRKTIPIYGTRLVREGRLPWPMGTDIRKPIDAATVFTDWLGNRTEEHFVVLLLTTRHRVFGCHSVAVGGLYSAPIHPREVFGVACASHAAAVILAHNHPSGDPEPSGDDLRITAKLQDAGKVVGVEVLDHVIVAIEDGQRKYTSLREKGHIK